MSTIPREQMQALISQLQQALANHEDWFAVLNRSLICRLPHQPNDLSENAYELCRFGQWLYGHASPQLREHPAFTAIESEHRHMHQYAARLLAESAAGSVPTNDYDLFAHSLQQLRLQIHSLNRELQDSLYNLDPLTGANSRTGMLAKLREQHELGRRGVQIAAIAMLDLDHFKAINDRYGHQVGDRVLAGCVQHLLNHLRIYDRVYRYGGEEFVLIMPATDLATAQRTTERLCQGIALHPILEDDRISATVSIGVTLLDPDVPVEYSIDRVDQAMYAAKAAGRNCVRVWEPAMGRFGSQPE